jgi:phage terminase small subunit
MPARHQKHRVKPCDCAWYTPPPAPRPALVEQQVWRTVIAAVPPDRLTDAQRWALSLWCQLESQWVVALEMLRRIGRGLIDPIIGRDRGGHRTARTPYQQIFRDAERQQRRLVRLLKFDPAGLLGGWRPGRKATPSPRGPDLS